MPNVKPIVSQPALAHIQKMEEKYSAEIAEIIKNTHIIRDSAKFREEVENNKRNYNFTSDQIILCESTQEALETKVYHHKGESCVISPDIKVAVLNFASYKHAGGGFLKGSCAQEESLCYSSTLYNVLNAFEDSYYAVNRGYLNDSLYTNAALYSEGVIFPFPRCEKYGYYKCDVITCAAPNWAAYRGKGGNYDQNLAVLYDRVKFIKAICTLYHVDVLFAGAWGCGVFRQDPVKVAEAFKKVFSEQKSDVQMIYHPIPNRTQTYSAFRNVITWNCTDPIQFPFVPRNKKASPSAVVSKDIATKYQNNQKYSDLIENLTSICKNFTKAANISVEEVLQHIIPAKN